MARTRHIRPGFFTNDALGRMRPVVRLLFAGLWTIADREGRLEDRPVKIQASVVPYDHFNVDKALTELASAGFITRYEVHAVHYIQICTWKKHQRPHPREDASVIPADGSTRVNPVVGPEDAPGSVPVVGPEDAPGSVPVVNPSPSRTSSSRTRTSTRTRLPLPPPQAEGDAPPDGAPDWSTNGHTNGVRPKAGRVRPKAEPVEAPACCANFARTGEHWAKCPVALAEEVPA